MQERLNRLRSILNAHHLSAALISNPAMITYLSGFSNFSPLERDGYVLVTPTSAYILTSALYTQAVKETVSHMTILETSRNISLLSLIKKVYTNEHLSSLGIETDNLTVREFMDLEPLFPELQELDLSELRILKDPGEIEAIQKACEIGDTAFARLLPQIKPGMSEKEVAFLLEMEIKKQSADLSFPTIVAFGTHSATPHHQTSEQKLKENDVSLIDFGVKYHNYCSDMTRTFFIGKAPEKLKEMYQVTLASQQKAVDFLNSSFALRNSEKKPLIASEVDTAARQYITSQGYPSIPHSLGHGIGLEVHEKPHVSPHSKEILTEGMVFSIEPGIYLPEIGGIRIEDLYTIQDNKLVQLTSSPKNLISL